MAATTRFDSWCGQFCNALLCETNHPFSNEGFHIGLFHSFSYSELRLSFDRTFGLVAMTSASHAEGGKFDLGQVYFHGNLQDTFTQQSIFMAHRFLRVFKLAVHGGELLSKHIRGASATRRNLQGVARSSRITIHDLWEGAEFPNMLCLRV